MSHARTSGALMLLILGLVTPARAADITITPADDLDGAVQSLQAGDTLILSDGEYLGEGIRFVSGGGDQGNPITVRAANDGGAVLNGEFVAGGFLRIYESSHVVVEGIFFRQPADPWYADTMPVRLVRSTDIVLRRVTGADATGNWSPIFNLVDSNYILVEDCAGYGNGKHSIVPDSDCHHITIRRFFSLWEYWQYGEDQGIQDWCTNTEVYGGNDVIVENFVGFLGPNPNQLVHHILIAGWNQLLLGSIGIGGNSGSFYFTGANDTLMEHIVSIDTTGDLGLQANRSRFDTPIQNDVCRHYTWISDTDAAHGVRLGASQTGDSLDVRNSFLQGASSAHAFVVNGTAEGALTHSHNAFDGFSPENLYVNTTAGENETFITPGWDTDRWGKGAYLMASRTALAGQGENGATIGADVLYRYQDGELTNEPLWPWPMEERILAESGVSVTWEDQGGIWKTLDGVYGPDDPDAGPGDPDAGPGTGDASVNADADGGGGGEINGSGCGCKTGAGEPSLALFGLLLLLWALLGAGRRRSAA